MNEELKPCPFCGSPNVDVRQSEFYTSGFGAICEDCGVSTTLFPTMKDAIDAWNRRVSHDVLTLASVSVPQTQESLHARNPYWL